MVHLESEGTQKTEKTTTLTFCPCLCTFCHDQHRTHPPQVQNNTMVYKAILNVVESQGCCMGMKAWLLKLVW
jgi:hypothetical protein